MKVKIKKLEEFALIPEYTRKGDAAMDLYATSCEQHDRYIEYGTGLSIEIPEGYVGLIFPRSSVSNMDLIMANSVGVIDSGYRGEIKVRFKTVLEEDLLYRKPDSVIFRTYTKTERIAQLMIIPIPNIEFEEVEELVESERGDGGFGSTGK